MKNTGVIHVFPLGMDERTIALLNTAFQMHYEEHYALVDNQASADLAIIDIDCPKGLIIMDRFLQANPQLRYLVISSREFDSDCFFLPKPIRVETLFPMLAQVRANPPQQKNGQINTVSSQIAQSDPNKNNAPVKLVLNLSQVEFFDASKGLLGCIKKAQTGNDNVVILFEKQPVLAVLPKEKIALLSCHLGTLQRLCQLAADNQFEIRPIPNNSPLPASPSFPLFNLLWQLAIWSANGRLEQSIKPDSPLIIKAWPNFTRVAPIPNAMRMTAFLVRMPVNMVLLHKLLNIPPSVIFNYLAAMQAVDYLVTLKQYVSVSNQVDIDLHKENLILITNTLTTETLEEKQAEIKNEIPSGKLMQKLLKKLSKV